MKSLVALFMAIGICLVEGSSWARKETSKTTALAGKDYIASIVQLPSIYHNCNAFFVAKDILIAPATCVLCDEVCEFQVAVSAVSVYNSAKFVKVKNITMHPQFLKFVSRGNPSFNIALIKLVEPVAEVEPLAISKTLHTREGYFRSWTFNKAMTDFHLRAFFFEKVTHYICDETNVKVKVDEICIQGLDAVELGKFNEGTVFVIDGETPNTPSSAMAFYTRSNSAPKASRYFPFISIPYYYDWLNATISTLSK